MTKPLGYFSAMNHPTETKREETTMDQPATQPDYFKLICDITRDYQRRLLADPPPTRREALEELYSLCCQWHEGGADRFPPGLVRQLDVVRTARP